MKVSDVQVNNNTEPRRIAMTPTEISAAYAALHKRWPELRPPDLYAGLDTFGWKWTPDSYLSPDLAHAACFMACLKACAERGCPVRFWGSEPSARMSGYFMPSGEFAHYEAFIPFLNPHTITKVVDGVMHWLPKAGT